MAALESIRERYRSDCNDMTPKGASRKRGRAATVSFRALNRARTTLDDFVKSYFPLHSLSPTAFFQWLPIFTFVEATIYRLDELNEDQALRGLRSPPPAFKDAWEELLGVLDEQDLLDARIRSELEHGRKYWERERNVCACLLDGKAAGTCISADMVHATSMDKSFDYRVLHLILFRLLEKPYDEPLLALLRVNEHLVDMADDLFDYEGDVGRNAFNILRVYVAMYGKDAPEHLVERISSFEARHRQLLRLVTPGQRAAHMSCERAAMDESTATSWVIPPLIYDEHAYRNEHFPANIENGA